MKFDKKELAAKSPWGKKSSFRPCEWNRLLFSNGFILVIGLVSIHWTSIGFAKKPIENSALRYVAIANGLTSGFGGRKVCSSFSPISRAFVATESSENPLCNHLSEIICEKTAVASAVNRKNERARRAISREFRVNASKRNSLIGVLAAMTGQTEIASAAILKRRNIDNIIDAYTALEKAGRIGIDDVNGYLAEITSSLKRKLHEKNPSADHSKIANLLDTLKVVSAEEWLRDLRSMQPVSGKKALKTYQETCKKNGIHEGASYLEDQNRIILCPGVLLHEDPDMLNFVLGHEATHAIYKYIPSSAKEKVRECLMTTLPSLYEVDSTGSKNEEKIEAFEEEALADMMSTSLLADSLRGSVKSRLQVQEILNRSYRAFCVPRDELKHPPALFRIDVLLASNPEIRKLMDCEPPSNLSDSCHL